MTRLFRRLFNIFLLASAVVLSSEAMAATIVVNDTGDPATGNPANCPAHCTLRDALAAADLTPTLDKIRFNITGTIYIKKQLIAHTPVDIDGGAKGTTIRIIQGYTIATLPDRFGNHDLHLTLQPDYYSLNEPFPPQTMLVLEGNGSSFSHMTLDGSITPKPADAHRNIDRIDVNSDSITDYFLHSADGQWLVGQGIYAHAINMHDNTVKYMRIYSVAVVNAYDAYIVHNHVFGGGAGEPYANSNCIHISNAAFPDVENNTVSGCKRGIALSSISGATVAHNHVTGNVEGIGYDTSDDSLATNRIASNVVDNNLDIGIFLAYIGSAPQRPSSTTLTVSNNEVKSNGHYGINVSWVSQVRFVDNDIEDNGSGGYFDSGLMLGTADSVVVNNTIKNNNTNGLIVTGWNNEIRNNKVTGSTNGSGLMLFEGGAHDNTVHNNIVDGNADGLVALAFDDQYPKGNTISYNEILHNLAIDAVDFDPVCQNEWINNTFDTSYAASGDSCIF